MPQRIQQIFMSICARCGHRWRSRKGKPLRCARCKTPYWDRPAKGRRVRGGVNPLNARAAATGGVTCTAEQARDILATWQANRSWVAITIEDNLVAVACCGFIEKVAPDGLDVSDRQRKTLRFHLNLHSAAGYMRQAGEAGRDEAYETLEIHFSQCLAYLSAFRDEQQSLRPIF